MLQKKRHHKKKFVARYIRLSARVDFWTGDHRAIIRRTHRVA